MLDAIKFRIFAGIAGLLLGLGALFTLSVALVLGLAELIGLTAGAFVAAALLLLLTGTCFYMLVRPDRSFDTEAGELKTAAAGALADLPFETMRKMADDRPLSLVTIAMILGYAIVRGPGPALRLFTALV